MRRRNVLKNEEAVSPVIATILMVAITVVLAATLYMMLPDAEETTNPVSGTISAEYEEDYGGQDVVIISFDVMGTPRQPELDDLEVNIVGDTQDPVEEDLSTDDLVDWSYLTEDDTVVRADSEIVLEWKHAETEEPNRVVIFIDGYDGSLTADI
ncbi:MAG: archaellin/type IV pilin N-terminal domain-containing protein [Candidatus Saliniplasma sp.]